MRICTEHWMRHERRYSFDGEQRHMHLCGQIFAKHLYDFYELWNSDTCKPNWRVKPLLYSRSRTHSLSLSPSPCVRTCVHLFVCNWICAHIISMPNINTLQFVEFIFMGYEPIPCNIPRANYVAAYIMCIVSLCCMLNSRSTNCSLVCNIQYLQSGYEHIAFFRSLSK